MTAPFSFIVSTATYGVWRVGQSAPQYYALGTPDNVYYTARDTLPQPLSTFESASDSDGGLD